MSHLGRTFLLCILPCIGPLLALTEIGSSHIAHYLLTEPKRDKENKGVTSHAKEAYRKLLTDTMLQGRRRILSFCNKPPAPVDLVPDILSSTQAQPTKQRRHIPKGYDLLFGVPSRATY